MISLTPRSRRLIRVSRNIRRWISCLLNEIDKPNTFLCPLKSTPTLPSAPPHCEPARLCTLFRITHPEKA
jgi:hypothetical protein